MSRAAPPAGLVRRTGPQPALQRPLVVLLALCLHVAPLAGGAAGQRAPPAGGPRTARAAIDALHRAQRSDVAPERLAALRALAAFDEPQVVDELLEILERDELAVFPLVRALLGSYGEPATIKRLLARGVRNRTPAVRAQVILALGEGRPDALDWRGLAGGALDDPSPLVRAAAVRALGRARAEEQLERILELALDSEERVRQEVPGALARLAGPRAEVVLGQLLMGDPRWRVRLAAACALADVKTPAAVARLVDALEQERGRLREDLVALLERLTGRAFGLDVVAWRAFLAGAPLDFLERGDALALARRLPPRYVGGGVRYYSIGTNSLAFTLVTDVSGSMSTPVPLAGRPEPEPRLAATQDELRRLLGLLDSRVAFNLVSFRDAARAWQPRLVAADARIVREAHQEIERYAAHGGTDIHAALDLVFDEAEAALDARLDPGPNPDTLFLLSDGVPSVGELRDPELLLAWAEERNRTLQLRIHCISLTAEPESRLLLERLAALGTGRYVQLVTAGG